MDGSHQNSSNAKFAKRLLQFHVDHIASFNASATPSSPDGAKDNTTTGPVTLLSPDEAMRRLRQLAQRQGLWTTHVTLTVGSQHLVVVDPMTGSVMEKFTLSLVYRPTVIRDGDLYDNVALITVLGDTVQRTAPEIHMFQCTDQPAQELIDAILDAKSKKTSDSSSKDESTGDSLWPEYVLKYEQAAQRTVNAVNMYQRSHPAPVRRSQPSRHPDNITNNVIIIKSVEVLNRCFDEIEQFMARLQSVADAFKELEKRRRSRKKKLPLAGDGMLSLRARNPPEKDFVEVFQKFKLSFNLLARLKSHIHDPNAPELVHFLFTPLSLVIEASKEPNQPVHLVSNVVVPLLTFSAVELLRNCLTSKEMELWSTLGEAWTKNRESWKGNVQSYQPRFSDGYEPEPVYWSDDLVTEKLGSNLRELSLKNAAAVSNGNDKSNSRPTGSSNASDVFTQDSLFLQQSPTSPILGWTSSDTDPSSLLSRQISSSSRNSPQSPVDVNQNSDVRDALSDKTTSRSQLVSRGHATSSRPGSTPVVPVKPFRSPPAMRNYDAQLAFLQSLHSVPERIYQAVNGYESGSQTELSVFKGDIIEVLENRRNWWRVRNYKGHTGLLPYSVLRAFSPAYLPTR